MSESSSGPRDDAPYCPSWCYDPPGPRMCPCGHHEGYHNDAGECLHAEHFTKCGCTGLPPDRRTPMDHEVAPVEPELVLAQVLQHLPAYAYRTSNELLVQDGIAEVLKAHEVSFERERLAGGDRFDFLCSGGVVIEVKNAGSYAEALRQAERYCRHDFVSAVVLASTRRWSGAVLHHAFHAKPVHVLLLQGRRL